MKLHQEIDTDKVISKFISKPGMTQEYLNGFMDAFECIIEICRSVDLPRCKKKP